MTYHEDRQTPAGRDIDDESYDQFRGEGDEGDDLYDPADGYYSIRTQIDGSKLFLIKR